jgi:hypothetical protein
MLIAGKTSSVLSRTLAISVKSRLKQRRRCANFLLLKIHVIQWLQLTKRELTLVDSSQFAVRLTLWGKQAEQFQASEQEVVAFKGVKVGDFGGMPFFFRLYTVSLIF